MLESRPRRAKDREPAFDAAVPDAALAAFPTTPIALNQIVEQTVQAVRDLLRAEAASVLLIDGDATLRFARVNGKEETLTDVRLSPGEGIVGWVVENGLAIAVPDVSSDLRFAPRYDEATGFVTHTVVAAPLWLGERLVGVVEAINRIGGEPFESEDARLLEELGRHLAIGLANVVSARALHARNAELEAEVESRIQQVVTAMEEWLQTIDGIRDPVLMVAEGYRVRRANRAASSWSGISVTEMPGKLCHELLFQCSDPCPGCPLECVLAGQTVAREIHLGDRSYEVQHSPIVTKTGGRPSCAVCTYRDVTEARALERRFQATECMVSVGRLAAGMAHEINNPLGFVASNLSSLESYLSDVTAAAQRLTRVSMKEPSSDGARDQQAPKGDLSGDLAVIDTSVRETGPLIQECLEGIDRVARIVRELGAFSDDGPNTEGSVAVIDAIEYAASEVGEALPEASVSIDGDRGLRVPGEGHQLVRAISAILRNAVQAAGRAEVEVFQMGPMVRIEVWDDGPGVPASVQSHEFEPFVTSRRVGNGKGLGLGLSVAYAVVTAMGGTIAIGSREPRGTQVRIELPVERDGHLRCSE